MNKRVTGANNGTKSGPDLNGNFNRRHNQVGAVLRPAAD